MNNTIPSYALPSHIAIIMDGNGRWAKNKGLNKEKGHREGLEAAKRVVIKANQMGIKYLSFYVFSTENWSRIESEVSFLMNLISVHLKKEYAFYSENNVKIHHIGNIDNLSKKIQKDIKNAEQYTKDNTGLNIALAINYGGQNEIIRALKKICLNVEKIHDKREKDLFLSSIDEKKFYKYLDTSNFPPVDFLIRTSGEHRISNFLLYQSAYAELFFDDKLWPDWTGDDFFKAIEVYLKRDRRFGGQRS